MLLKVVFPSTMELDTFIGQLQKFGRTSTQIVFSTPVAPMEAAVMDSFTSNELELMLIRSFREKNHRHKYNKIW